MKHSIRQRVINEYGLPVVKVEQVNGELGSGIFDKNGKEIFEGDLVKIFGEEVVPVTFKLGQFWAGDFDFAPNIEDLEIIGHAED